MGDSFNLVASTLRYNGLFDFDGLYAAVVDWAKNYGYRWHETSYKHKVPSPKGAEDEMTWVLSKKVTEYIKYEMLILVHMWDLTEVEVEVSGKKKHLSNARIDIIIKPTLSYDWQGRLSGTKIADWLGKIYLKAYTKDVESIYGDQLHYRVLNLHALMKKYLDLQTKKYAYKGYLGEN